MDCSTIRVAALFSAMIMSACSAEGVRSPIVASPTVESPDGFITYDDLLAEVAAEVVGFGGMFFDDSGALNVYLTATEPDTQAPSRETIKAALTRVFGDDILTTIRHDEGAPAPQMVAVDLKVIQGQFDIPTLLEARRYADNTLSLDGVVFTDLDEARNRVSIGVENEAARQQVVRMLDELGISPDMVIIEDVEPVRPLALTQQFRPPLGGIQIQKNFGAPCTLGFHATRNGVRGFVTNSHCTNVWGGAENTLFFQPVDSIAAEHIGVELVDPPYWSGGWCPRGRSCRFSDSAFVGYTADVAASLGPSAPGRIARTDPPGAIFIDDSNPSFQIVSKAAWPLVGLVLSKVGRTTGWTSGTVTNTCTNVNTGSQRMHLCQVRFERPREDFPDNPLSAEGDSGAPVFRLLGGNNVSLYGILWGGAGIVSYFSPMQSIEGELGALTVTPVELP
jgi:hypothetical protein